MGMREISWDRPYTKQEVIDFFDNSFESNYKVIKSALVETTYYAAIKKDNVTFAVICPFRFNEKERTFFFTSMTENVGPVYEKCPKAILKKLTEPESETAKNWRNRCFKKIQKTEYLKTCPVGTTIRFQHADRAWELTKQAPAYQFKKEWWRINGDNRCYRQKHIPLDYEIVSNIV